MTEPVKISFEGPRASGKTVLSNTIKEYLEGLAVKVENGPEQDSLLVTLDRKDRVL